MIYNKLVRDKIPEIIKSKGNDPITQILNPDTYKAYLDLKLSEELQEYIDSDSVEELADLVEVVYAVLKYKGVGIEEFENVRLKKANERGIFDSRICLIEVKWYYTFHDYWDVWIC